MRITVFYEHHAKSGGDKYQFFPEWPEGEVGDN